MFVAVALVYQSSQKQIKICIFEITSDARIWFQMVSWATLLVVVRHKQLSQGTRWWYIIIGWRNTHNNTEPNAIWFPATLTDTEMNIQGVQVKYRTNGNCNIPAAESRLRGTKWYYSCLVPKFACCVAGPTEFFIQLISIESSRTASPGAVL